MIVEEANHDVPHGANRRQINAIDSFIFTEADHSARAELAMDNSIAGGNNSISNDMAPETCCICLDHLSVGQ